jgi:hypothetical protein
MAIRTNALYLDLLEDLRDYLPPEAALIGDAADLKYYPDMSPKQYAATHLAKSFLKKFQDRSTLDADRTAMDKFLRSNIRCKDWQLRINDLKDEILVGLFRQEIYSFFSTGSGWIIDSTSDIVRAGDVGPGASLQARGNDFYTKLFSGPLTSTSKRLHTFYTHHLGYIPYWAKAELDRQAQFGKVQIVAGNKLSFVPKNVDASRVICTEPLLNMFFQKGIEAILKRRLKSRFKIDLATQQDVNRDLAKLGSITDKLSTIDLSSASDSVAYNMVKEFLPRDLVAWFDLCRSPVCTLPTGEEIKLHMISSMGNAFTFPLQTILFSCVVSAVYKAMDIPMRCGISSSYQLEGTDLKTLIQTDKLPNFGVFGDDIIVESQAHNLVVRLLNILGFEVNAEKSFSQGPFRESCGGDFFLGRPVRGVYLKSLRSQASRYVAINRLNEWSAIQGIPLRRTIYHLVKTVRWLPVPLYEEDDAGIRVPMELLDLSKRDKATGFVKYRRWSSIPHTIKITEGAFKLEKGMKTRIHNPGGLLQAFLRGDIRSDTLTVRHGQTRYRTKWGVTPFWNYIPKVGVRTPIGQKRLITALLRNLS